MVDLVIKDLNKNWDLAGLGSLELWLPEPEFPFPFRSQIFKLIPCFIPIIQMTDSGNTQKMRMKRPLRLMGAVSLEFCSTRTEMQSRGGCLKKLHFLQKRPHWGVLMCGITSFT